MTDIHTRGPADLRLTKPVTLVGMMGSGKSTLGADLGRALDVPFYDSDKIIEKEQGKAISDIFAQDGEAAFRAMELATVQALIARQEPCIIATGGGSVTVPEISDLIFGQSLSVWIDAPLDVLVERTGKQKNRPLLQTGDPRQILASLLEKRAPVYARAAIRVVSDENSSQDITERTMRQIGEYLLQHGA